MKFVSCVQLCDPMDYSLSGSSVHGIFQARILEWVAISFSNSLSQFAWMNVHHWLVLKRGSIISSTQRWKKFKILFQLFCNKPKFKKKYLNSYWFRESITKIPYLFKNLVLSLCSTEYKMLLFIFIDWILCQLSGLHFIDKTWGD